MYFSVSITDVGCVFFKFLPHGIADFSLTSSGVLGTESLRTPDLCHTVFKNNLRLVGIHIKLFQIRFQLVKLDKKCRTPLHAVLLLTVWFQLL